MGKRWRERGISSICILLVVSNNILNQIPQAELAYVAYFSFFFSLSPYVISTKIIAFSFSGVARGGAMGAVHPGRHFWEGKIKVIPKNLEREKVFRGGEKF